MTPYTLLVLHTLLVAFTVFSAGLTLQGQTSIINATSLSVQNLTNPDLLCDPEYGRNLDAESCQQAYLRMDYSTGPVTLGERGTGSWDVVLPYRFLSGESCLKRPLQK